jgi:hypothetical protein
MIIDKINNSYLCYTNNQVIHTREYYNYILVLLKEWLSKSDVNLNVIFGNYFFDFKNNNKTLKIDIQCEHTLVKEGGRSVNDIIYGNVENTDGYYLVRIDKFDYLNSLDYIIEYSQPNIENIKSCKKFEDFLSKVIYISPMIYPIKFYGEKSKVITLFESNSNNRRRNILEQMNKLKINNYEVNNCFSNECLLELYNETKIMVNVHQTEHHHTFEELRVLPALINGVIIISEDVPLKEKIPYNEFIVWADYDNISNKTLDVLNNYELYYDKIFKNPKLTNILNEMINKNQNIFKTI